jgi:hypothetical protein
MRITPYAAFESDWADDSVEVKGDIVVPAGQNMMRAMRDELAKRKYQVSNFDQHSFYGWSFDLNSKQGDFWLLLQCPGPWLLTAHDSRMIWTRFLHGPAGFAGLIDHCRESLESIPQIGSIQWMTREEYEAAFHGKTTQK